MNRRQTHKCSIYRDIEYVDFFLSNVKHSQVRMNVYVH